MKLCSLLLLAGCGITRLVDDPPGPAVGVVTVEPEQKGDLDYRNFVWRCVHAREQTCLARAGASVPFPKRVALGAQFALDGEDGASVRYAGTRFLRELTDSWLAEQPGTVVFYTLEGVRTADFIHLRIIAPTSLSLATDPSSNVRTSMLTGETQTVAVQPMAEDALLAGSLSVAWETSNPEVLAFDDGPGSSPAKTLRAVAPGSATITVSSPSISNTFTFSVVAP